MTAHDAASFLTINEVAAPYLPLGAVSYKESLETQHSVEKLTFIPYCLRDNRGGKGHMRVGLRRRHL